jgi:hypothetical protein
MKCAIAILALGLALITDSTIADASNKEAPLIYINKNIGFNVEGYKYTQSEFPCNIDKLLVEKLITKASDKGIRLEAVNTADKIRNGVIPVLAIDVEQLVLGDKKFGTQQESKLPKVQITAALIKSKDEMVTAKHTCAIMTLNDLTPSTNILDLGAPTVCTATRKCLSDLSRDVIEWIEPQL